jgi:KaiC/GvpD/RAD55 family RecA-like ATPase
VNATFQQQLRLKLQVFDPTIRIIMSGLPLPVPVPLASVTLYQKGAVQEVLTGVNGVASFKTVPAGNYTVHVDYSFVTYEFPLNVQTNGPTIVTVPFPHRTISLIGVVAFLSLASVVLVRRRRGKLYPRSFGYFTELTQGSLPETCFIVISGNSGSGKSVLLNSLAAEHLALGKSIYITNTEYPDKTRENLLRLGVTEEGNLRGDKLIFIDAYSAVGGGLSKEEFSVASHTDLTNLSLKITKCLEITGPGADVYFDSLNPLISALRIDYLINFLQSVAAKVKANGGRFCVTVGTGIEKADLTKLEEASDCVIETELQESGSGQRRRLRIKKLRDRPYIDRWTRFQVQQGKGIVFLTRSKPAAVSDV